MKLKLSQDYGSEKEGKEFEILDIEYDPKYLLGVGVLVNIEGEKQWLTIAWFIYLNQAKQKKFIKSQKPPLDNAPTA